MDYTEYSVKVAEKNDFYYALFSDLHVDAPSFAKSLFIADAEKYKALGARFLFNGDIFDAILPTDRKRYSRGNDEVNEDAQINAKLSNPVS